MQPRNPKGRKDGRTGARRPTWLVAAPDASGYNPVTDAAGVVEAGRSASSKSTHAGIKADYLDFCHKTGVHPTKVDETTAAHVANFYFSRTRQWALGLSTSKHISAEMTTYFTELGHAGRWTTGKSADGVPFWAGNPNDSDKVEQSKRAHKIKLAQDGKVKLPVDPLEYGHMCAYYDHFLCDKDIVEPARLCQHAAMMVATFLLLRFDEVSKIRYVYGSGLSWVLTAVRLAYLFVLLP